MNNQQQATLANPGVAAPDQMIHNSLGSFVGGRTQALNKPSYQTEMTSSLAQLSHFQQQQPHNISSYLSSMQMAQDEFSSNFGNMSSQQSAGFRNFSGFDLDNNSQLGMQHQVHQPHQNHKQASPPQIRYRPPQPASQSLQETYLPHHQQSALQSIQQSYLQQQQFQFQKPPQTHQSTSHQQNLPIQHHRLHQQHTHQQKPQIQPKQILQNPAKTSLSASQQSSQTSLLESQPQTPAPTLVKSDQPISGDVVKDNNKVADKPVDNEPTKEPKNITSEKLDVVNNKEKTPLCLINELAHYNKLCQRYELMDEQGPAHKKTFHVKLKLADEEYSASGDSIKKAQSAAAVIALKETKYTHPPPRSARFGADITGRHTPTMELHALAIKRGESVIYKTIEPQLSPYHRQPGVDYKRLYNMRYHEYMNTNRDPYYHGNSMSWPIRHLHSNRMFYVCLCVGWREFIAEGMTRQEARHNAALKALGILRNLPTPDNAKKGDELIIEEINADGLKSEISLVHEIALRRNLAVTFEVIFEAGPPHMKSFITKCTVGDTVTEGEGNSKKASKKRAAELMLEELKKLPAVCVSTFPRLKTKIPGGRKKTHNLVKSELQQQKADPNYGGDINPISRLIQIMQAKKKKDPTYTLIFERGLPTREFVIQVEVEDKTCTGTGPNKKVAKRAAAEAMLQSLGYTKQSPQPTKSALKHSTSLEGSQSVDKRVKFVETGTDVTSNKSQVIQQKVPGLLHLPSGCVPNSQAQSKQSQVKQASRRQPESKVDDLCQAFDNQMKIDNQNHMEGQEQQSFLLRSNSRDSCLDKSIHICGDGPGVKDELVTSSSVSFSKVISK